jgi:hypothetical protein
MSGAVKSISTTSLILTNAGPVIAELALVQNRTSRSKLRYGFENDGLSIAYKFEVLTDETLAEMEKEYFSQNNMTIVEIPRHTC